MRIAAWIVGVALCIPLLAGCTGGGGDAPTAEDKTFQDQRQKAFEDSKGAGAPKRSSKGQIPAEVKADMAKGGGGAAADATKAGEDTKPANGGAGNK